MLNHVILHQTVIGLEAMKQMEMAGEGADIVIGCTGGSSNFGGIAFPPLGAQLCGGPDVRIVAAEPAACPSLTKGWYAYDFGDTAHLMPLAKMYTLGVKLMPPGVHAGSLRYHGMAPLVSHAMDLGLMEALAFEQTACFAAAVQFARAEEIALAPDSSHALRAANDEALRAKREGRKRSILVNVSGHGHFDMSA